MTPTATKSAVRFVVLAVLIDAMGFGIIMPVLPELVMKLGAVDLPEATRIGGWLGLVYALVQFVCGPLAGNLGDRFGRRPVLIGALGGFTIDYALLSFAPSLGWLFVGRALAGLFGASYGPAFAAMADLSKPEDRARHFGYLSAAFGVGFVAGPALGGLLGELGPRAPFYAAAILAGLNFLFGLLVFPETLAPENRRPFQWRRANPLGALLALRHAPGVLRLASVGFWWDLAGMVYPVTWAFWAVAAFGWSPGLIGASLAWVGLLMAASNALIVGRVVKRVGERRAAAIGIAGGALQFLAYAVITEGWMVFVIMLLMPLQSLVLPSLNGLMSRQVPGDQQGELQGFNGSIQALASIIAPLIFSPALAWFSGGGSSVRFVGVAFAMAAASALVALAILLATRDPKPAV